MKQRVADYIADFLADHGVNHVFSVVGGGAMHLNDALGNSDRLSVVYTQHEQGASIAAEGFARIKGSPACVCVTSGPGGTNALTGVLCAWQDSIPMMVISGQVRHAITVANTGLPLRQFGEQEYTIVESAAPMTKYAVMVDDASRIKYHLERALWEATAGRRGPVWIDVPLDIQNAQVDPTTLEGFTPPAMLVPKEEDFSRLVEVIENAERPVILVGSGVRSACQVEQFRKVVEKLRIPVVSATSVADVMANGEPWYCGGFGASGGRAGNILVQNADVLISFGCSLSFKHVGFTYELFAPDATKVVVDVDDAELRKPTIKRDVPIHCDLEPLFECILASDVKPFGNRNGWVEYAEWLVGRFPVCVPHMLESEAVNQYYFYQRLFEKLDDDGIVVTGPSVACIAALQTGTVAREQRVLTNANCGTMGYCVPAAIGAVVAGGDGRQVVLTTGDGSLQMNVQELQTLASRELPIKTFVFSNGGYQAVMISQKNNFGRLSGCTPESGMALPEIEGLARAYGIPYRRIENHEQIDDVMNDVLAMEGPVICEVMQDLALGIEPKSQAKRMPDGSLVSSPIYDLAPFLSDEEMELVQFSSRAWERSVRMHYNGRNCCR